MKIEKKIFFIPLLLATLMSTGQGRRSSNAEIKNPMVEAIVKEAMENSQLEILAHELLDSIGPRLVGTPEMQKAGDWALAKYKTWGIGARNEKYGEWRGWQRGVAHVDMIHPRVRSLEATQLAWSPGTNGKTVSGEVIVLPAVADSLAFVQWLPSVKGKIVLISVNQPTGRPDYNWDEFGTKESVEKMKKERDSLTSAWNKRISSTGYNSRTLPVALENAGAAAVAICNWSKGFGANKIFGASTKKVPTIDLSLEDYGMLYRLAQSGAQPRISMKIDSKDLPVAPAFNIIGEIKGTEKPEEYVMLSAHFDSWDGATGATDNGSGTILMMEVMRILKKLYPNPKRTILVGHWGSEEQGLNGSRAFVEDNPNIVNNLQALFNQDNGTGRVVNISGQGFLHSYEYIGRWMSAIPSANRTQIETNFPGRPGAGGSDFASFVAVGAPAFSLSSNSWSYGTYTWHTNRDTYDKLVFDDIKNNVIVAAVMAYMASEDPEKTSREKSVMPINNETGKPGNWPEQRKATRKGGLD